MADGTSPSLATARRAGRRRVTGSYDAPMAAGDLTDDRSGAYKAAGVDLGAADEALARIGAAVASTYTPGVIRGLGAFGGLFALPGGMREPTLVASTDGVGTKTVIAAATGRLRQIGRDLVNHCVNDILVQGAEPLFFLDYVASSRLEPDVVAEVVTGVAEACREAGMALLGGETAEMPGVYVPGQLDVAGTIVGIVERAAIVDGSGVAESDVLLAFESGGLQTNGFSLARHLVLSGGGLAAPLPGDADERTVGAALMTEHRSFLPAVRPLLAAGLVKAMAHITGGGLPGNLPRSLPTGLGAVVRRGSWPVPAIFEHLVALGDVREDDAYSAFNMGVGFVLVVSPTAVKEVGELVALSPAGAWARLHRIGEVVPGSGVRLE